ncbi:MAG TPA: phosphoenolpyruvate--protein phosphotransferase [Firmicutes bacterium]|nr:phosphoenolpyruvate--protein phosphotransferase [Bacillota bacterium]
MAGEKKALVFKGIAASPGIAGGPVYQLEARELKLPTHRLSPEKVPEEIAAFQRALEETGRQLEAIKQRVAREIGEDKAAIFGAHQLVLQDPALVDEVEKRIRQGTNGAQAIAAVASELAEMLAQLEDEYLRERAGDIRDVGERILRNFLGVAEASLAHLQEPVVVFARDLTPSETAQLRPDRVLAFATIAGGRTSHVAIMARSLEIPAVVGLGEKVAAALPGAREAIIDGTRGEVILNPTPADWAEYRERKERYQEYNRRLVSLGELPAQTPDGHRVELYANIASPADLPGVEKVNAEGIGLFRTEFLYMDRNSLPTEEEQFQAYREVVERLAPRPVIIRTLDIGGDKDLPYLNLTREVNPFLGWRALRYCLDRPDVFKVQLAAILRASAYGTIRLMFPMIISVEEVRRARAVLAEVKEELDRRGEAYDDRMPVGVMIETPGAALTADILAREVDFFSIGTNDLIQYSLAVDRGNERVSHLFETFHPGVLRLIKGVVDAGHGAGIPVYMCGEMAGEVLATPLLLGFGLDELSMSPSSLPRVKQVIRSLSWRDARQMANHALGLNTAGEIKAYMERCLGNLKLD